MHFFSSNNGPILLALASLMLFTGEVASHGHMTSPLIRIAPGDQNNGLTITRGPTRIQPCAGNAPGPIMNTFAAGSVMPINWEIGAAHQGTCFVEISTSPDTNFQVLKQFPNCADENGSFSDTVPLPADVACDHCTIRWRWEAKLTGELYLDCADVKITGSGGQAPATAPAAKAVVPSSNTTATPTVESTSTSTDQTTMDNPNDVAAGPATTTTTATSMPTSTRTTKAGKKGKGRRKSRANKNGKNKHSKQVPQN